eukprot:5574784-Pleurochrysis_carterae.AAC.1
MQSPSQVSSTHARLEVNISTCTLRARLTFRLVSPVSSERGQGGQRLHERLERSASDRVQLSKSIGKLVPLCLRAQALCVIEELIAAADATRGRLLQAQLLCVRARVLARAARLAEALEDAEEACACAHAHACACSCAGACANACQTVSAGHPMPNPPAIDSVAREALLLRGSVLFAMRRKREARVTLEQLVHALSTCNVRARGESVCDDDKLGGRLAETSLQAASIDTSESLELERAAMQRERAMRLLERC